MQKVDRIRALAKETEQNLDKGIVPDWRIAIAHLYGLRQALIICQPAKFRALQTELEDAMVRINRKFNPDKQEKAEA